MKVLVCGSRDWPDLAAIYDRIAALPAGSLVIEGGAPGADLMAARAARKAGLHCAEVAALWDNGRRAGPGRNRAMLDLEPELVIAFQVGNSSGTQDTMNEARKRGIPVELHKR
jgi:hypothetical protein